LKGAAPQIQNIHYNTKLIQYTKKIYHPTQPGAPRGNWARGGKRALAPSCRALKSRADVRHNDQTRENVIILSFFTSYSFSTTCDNTLNTVAGCVAAGRLFEKRKMDKKGGGKVHWR